MTWLYNAFRVLSRVSLAFAGPVLTAGKAEPFGLKFESEQATLLAVGLLVLSFLSFNAESWAKRRAGL